MGSRAPRVTMTIKLAAGKDDDLINWWQSISVGRRQAVIKAILRKQVQPGVQEPIVEDSLTQIGQDTAWLREAFRELPAHLENLLARVAVVQTAPPQDSAQPTRTDRLTEGSVARREERIAGAGW
jgi:hypothetical protein